MVGVWVYVRSEPRLWTVGFYAPDGTWHTDSDHATAEGAAARAAWLNGSGKREPWSHGSRLGGPDPCPCLGHTNEECPCCRPHHPGEPFEAEADGMGESRVPRFGRKR